MSSPEIAGLYGRMRIQTANKAAIICMLHHKCVQLIQLSLQSPVPNRKKLAAAQNILAQFEHSLDTKNDALAQQFFGLYDYCYRQLGTNRSRAHRSALSTLTKIRDAFDLQFSRAPRHCLTKHTLLTSC